MKKNKYISKLLNYLFLAISDFLIVKIFVFIILILNGDRLFAMSIGLLTGLIFAQVLFSLITLKYYKLHIRLLAGILISCFSFLVTFTIGLFLKVSVDSYGFYDLIVKFIIVSILFWEIFYLLLYRFYDTKLDNKQDN